jgi:hypothetical protein
MTQGHAEIPQDDRLPQRRWCLDCGCEAQQFASGWRCPWATSSHGRAAWVDGEQVTSCAAPYVRERNLVLPSETRTR